MTMRKAKSSKVTTRFWVSLVALTLVFSGGALFKKKNQLEDVKVEKSGDFFQVVLTTNNPGQQPLINRLVDPIRIIVDFADTKIGKNVPPAMVVGNGIINQLTVEKVSENKTDTARVTIGLDKMMAYDLAPEDNRLVIILKPAEQAAEAPASDLYPRTGGQLIVEKSGQPAATPLEPTPLQPTAEIPASATGEATVSEMLESTAAGSTVATVPSSKTATKLLDVVLAEQNEQTAIQLVMDGIPGDFKSFEMKNPARLVLDLWKTKLLYPGPTVMVNSQGIAKVRIAQHPDKVRLVFDSTGAKLPSYNIARQGERLVVTVSQSINVTGPAAPVLAAPIVESPAAGPELPTAGPAPAYPAAAPEQAGMVKVNAVDFKYTAQNSTVVVKTSAPVKFEKRENPEDLIFSLVLKNAKIPPELERSLDTTEFASPLNLIGSFQSQPGEVNIVVNLNNWVPAQVRQDGAQIEIVFANPGASVSGPVPVGPVPAGTEEIAPPSAPAPAAPPLMAPPVSAAGRAVKIETMTGTKIYTGAPIKIDAKNLDILDALRAIAEVSGLNIITSDDVRGRLTLKLDNVPWDQALDLILETKGLGMVQYGSVVRVAPVRQIQKEQEDAFKNIQQRQNLRPLQTRIIPLNFAKASDIQPQIKSVLSERGTVDVDRRTNALIIKDIPERIQDIQVMISSLDTRTPQVLIEARIVEASTSVSREIGVNWGINYNSGPAWGNGTGLNFPNTIQMGGAVLGGQLNPISPSILNTAGAQGGAVGFTFGSLTGALSLDLLLKSLEAENKAKIISSPRIMTMDNQRATITQGVTIPYPPAINLAQGGGGGQQWLFVEAALRLEVTPHISPDGTVVLEVKASNNTPDLKVVSGGAPAIDKKEAETQVILKDGETMVIGGIYTTKDTETLNQTPFLSKIPWLGKLFQDKFTEKQRNEMLIFLTPRVIK